MLLDNRQIEDHIQHHCASKDFFDKDWNTIWESYKDGFECKFWIEENLEWLKTITTDKYVMEQIYNAINAKDFRTGSCGGCI